MPRLDGVRRSGVYLLSLVAALQQVSRLVVLQVADAGIGSSAQEQLQDLLLMGIAMETSRHVQRRVTMSLKPNGRSVTQAV